MRFSMRHNLLTFRARQKRMSPPPRTSMKYKKPQTPRLPTGFGRRANGLSTGLAASVKNQKLADKLKQRRIMSGYVSPRDLIQKPDTNL